MGDTIIKEKKIYIFLYIFNSDVRVNYAFSAFALINICFVRMKISFYLRKRVKNEDY